MDTTHETVLDNGASQFHMNVRLRTADQISGPSGTLVHTIPAKVLLRAAKVMCDHHGTNLG